LVTTATGAAGAVVFELRRKRPGQPVERLEIGFIGLERASSSACRRSNSARCETSCCWAAPMSLRFTRLHI
jgi:hypothetical protein